MLTDTGLTAVIDTTADNRHFNLRNSQLKQRNMRIDGDDPRRKMG